MVRLLQDLEEIVQKYAQPINFEYIEEYALVMIEFHATYCPQVMKMLYFGSAYKNGTLFF